MALAEEPLWSARQGPRDVPPPGDGAARPGWMAEAACREHPEISFFPVRGESTATAAKAVCRRCPVRAECSAYAVEHDEVGIWGGTSERQRRRSARRPPEAHG